MRTLVIPVKFIIECKHLKISNTPMSINERGAIHCLWSSCVQCMHNSGWDRIREGVLGIRSFLRVKDSERRGSKLN